MGKIFIELKFELKSILHLSGFLKSDSFKLDVSLGWRFYENFVPTKNGFKKIFFTLKVVPVPICVLVMLRAWLTPGCGMQNPAQANQVSTRKRRLE